MQVLFEPVATTLPACLARRRTQVWPRAVAGARALSGVLDKAHQSQAWLLWRVLDPPVVDRPADGQTMRP